MVSPDANRSSAVDESIIWTNVDLLAIGEFHSYSIVYIPDNINSLRPSDAYIYASVN